jgi:hypothetical protein
VFGAFTGVLLKFELSVDFSILVSSQQRGHAASAKWGSLLSFCLTTVISYTYCASLFLKGGKVPLRVITRSSNPILGLKPIRAPSRTTSVKEADPCDYPDGLLPLRGNTVSVRRLHQASSFQQSVKLLSELTGICPRVPSKAPCPRGKWWG